MTPVAVSLPDSVKRFVDFQVSAKGFGDVGDYLLSLVRQAQAREEEARLETLLLEGLASSRSPLDSDFWQSLDSRVETLIERGDARQAE